MARWTMLGLITLSGLATACGSSSDDAAGATTGAAASSSGTGSGGEGGAGTSGSTGTGMVDPCGMAPLSGDPVIMIDHGGVTRQYTLHIPPSYDGTQHVPLVMNFHGFTSNMAQQVAFS